MRVLEWLKRIWRALFGGDDDNDGQGTGNDTTVDDTTVETEIDLTDSGTAASEAAGTSDADAGSAMGGSAETGTSTNTTTETATTTGTGTAGTTTTDPATTGTETGTTETGEGAGTTTETGNTETGVGTNTETGTTETGTTETGSGTGGTDTGGTHTGIFVRREAGALGSDTQQWDPILEHYARAIATMQSRPASDPTSWEAQAGIHGDSCQHANWHFLPWHRMYLYRFEEIVRQAVLANGGPSDWALPFWDYEHNATIPWVFRQSTLPDGTPNPLNITGRNARLANGGALSVSETEWSQARSAQVFAAGSNAEVAISLGGPPTGAAFFGRGFGALEQQPHNGIHVAVGGLMGRVPTAGLDPLFWLHHCNIDRLWEIWNREGGINTASPDWLSESFDFVNTKGDPVTDVNRDVEDTEQGLAYTYEGLPPIVDSMIIGDEPGEAMPAEMIGASAQAVTLTTGTETVPVTLDAPVGPGMLEGSIDDAPGRVYLVVDNVSGTDAPNTNYEVILDMGTPADDSDDFVVGVAAFFGLVEAGDVNNQDAPHGLTFTYDITTVVDRLRARGLWDDTQVRVSFRAIDDIDTPAVTVGSVRVFVE